METQLISVRQELVNLIAEQRGISTESFTVDDKYGSPKLDLDSLDQVEIIMMIEEKFGIAFDWEVKACAADKTIQELIAHVESKLLKKKTEHY